MSVSGYIGAVAIAVMAVIYIILWIYILYYKIKCRRIKECQNENCVNRGNCDKVKLTENEKERLLAMIERLGKTQAE